DTSQLTTPTSLKHHIRASLQDFQQIREYFTTSLDSLHHAFSLETQQYAQKFTAVLDRLKRFEEIIKKATLLQKKLKTQLDLAKQELTLSRHEKGGVEGELEELRNQLFVARNEGVVLKAEVQDLRLEGDKWERRVREKEGEVDGYKKELYVVRGEVEVLKASVEREKVYSGDMERRVREVEEAGRRRVEEAEREREKGGVEEARYLEKVKVCEQLNKECQVLEHEIAEVQRMRFGEKKALEGRLREMEEEL
ncbi:hypothetical protein HDU98_006150, partial [Podochytrium sp. JEL0797]